MRGPGRRNQGAIIVATGWTLAAVVGALASAQDRQKAQEAYREGNGLLDQGLFRQAVAAYNAAIAEDPQFVQAYHNLALASEMVDRKQALDAWKRFVDVATGREEFKFDLARAQARLQILEALPPLPDTMHPNRYVPEAGDYYWEISRNSEGEEWNRFPVRVFLGNAPDIKWQQGAREAYAAWAAVFPLELVSLPQQADIRVSWEGGVFEKGHVGGEMEWVRVESAGGTLAARRIAVIAVDLRFPWSKDDMRAIITHEMGHALGIKGHSSAKKDIMFMEKQETRYRVPVPGLPRPIFWRFLVKQPSPRDINTLIRLYNHAGSSVRFR